MTKEGLERQLLDGIITPKEWKRLQSTITKPKVKRHRICITMPAKQEMITPILRITKGEKRTIPYTLYYIKIDKVYKIGITSKTVKERFGNLSNIKIIHLWHGSKDRILSLESYVLNKYKQKRGISTQDAPTIEARGGKTECFYDNVLTSEDIRCIDIYLRRTYSKVDIYRRTTFKLDIPKAKEIFCTLSDECLDELKEYPEEDKRHGTVWRYNAELVTMAYDIDGDIIQRDTLNLLKSKYPFLEEIQ